MNFFKEKIIWPVRYRRAVRRADRLAHLNQCNQYVICVGGRLIVWSKREIEMAVAQGIFKKGVRPWQIRKMAIYTAR